MELTPWFDKYTRPVRSGVYRVASTSKPLYSYWDVDTAKWGLVSYTVKGAQGMRDKPSHQQYRFWKGTLKGEST